MLDENLPTFHFKPSSDSPLASVVYFTQHGNEPTPEYIFKRADPAVPASRNRYAVALADPYSADVVYAECVVEPEWTQPTLSAAELRAQSQNPTPSVPATPTVPDSFTLQLYNPDQTISVKMIPGSWNKTESWEFEMPTQSFKPPSTSELDRASPATADLTPRITFRWRKDGRLSKDMTCYMTGKSLGGRKSKEPDITVALFKHARESSAVTVYEPNLQRVEVEDRKGLDIVLVLGAEVIKDLYVAQRHDVFNISPGTPPAAASRRKNSRPTAELAATTPPQATPAMSGALANAPPVTQTQAQAVPPVSRPSAAAAAAPPAASSAAIDAETRRLQAMVEKEAREREKRDAAEQKRIKKMLEDEEKERRRREAEVAKETERLRKKYGVDGQDLPSSPKLQQRPNLPPRPQQQPQPSLHGFGSWLGGGQSAAPPPRPVSAGPVPVPGPFNNSTLNSWWHGPVGAPAAPVVYPPAQAMAPPPPPQPQGAPAPQGGRRQTGGSSGLGELFHLGRLDNSSADRQRIQKKRSSHW